MKSELLLTDISASTFRNPIRINMSRLILFVVLFTSFKLAAQRDLITTQAGEEIRCRILDETPTRFRYAYIGKGDKILRNEIFKNLVKSFKYNYFDNDLVKSKDMGVSAVSSTSIKAQRVDTRKGTAKSNTKSRKDQNEEVIAPQIMGVPEKEPAEKAVKPMDERRSENNNKQKDIGKNKSSEDNKTSEVNVKDKKETVGDSQLNKERRKEAEINKKPEETFSINKDESESINLEIDKAEKNQDIVLPESKKSEKIGKGENLTNNENAEFIRNSKTETKKPSDSDKKTNIAETKNTEHIDFDSSEKKEITSQKTEVTAKKNENITNKELAVEPEKVVIRNGSQPLNEQKQTVVTSKEPVSQEVKDLKKAAQVEKILPDQKIPDPYRNYLKYRVGVKTGIGNINQKALENENAFGLYKEKLLKGWTFGADAAYFPKESFGLGFVFTNFQSKNSNGKLTYTNAITDELIIDGKINNHISTKFIGPSLFFRKGIDFKTFVVLGLAPGMYFYSDKGAYNDASFNFKGKDYGAAATLGLDFLLGNDLTGRDIILSLEAGYNYGRLKSLDYGNGQGPVTLSSPIIMDRLDFSIGLRFMRFPHYLKQN